MNVLEISIPLENGLLIAGAVEAALYQRRVYRYDDDDSTSVMA